MCAGSIITAFLLINIYKFIILISCIIISHINPHFCYLYLLWISFSFLIWHLTCIFIFISFGLIFTFHILSFHSFLDLSFKKSSKSGNVGILEILGILDGFMLAFPRSISWELLLDIAVLTITGYLMADWREPVVMAVSRS